MSNTPWYLKKKYSKEREQRPEAGACLGVAREASVTGVELEKVGHSGEGEVGLEGRHANFYGEPSRI